MQSEPTHSGDLSQDSASRAGHPNGVTPMRKEVVDPATRTGRGFYHAVSASSVGLEFGIAVALALGVGIYLDGKAGTEPWLMLLFMVLGLAAGFRGVIRAMRRSDRAAEAEGG